MPDVHLPTLHKGQVAAFLEPGRFKAIRCGRRWGKTVLGEAIACDRAAKGKAIGMFAPDYKILAETFNDVADILAPIKTSSNKIEGVFRTSTGGRIDYWSLENERAGRSRKYHWLFIDEGAFTKPNMTDIWQKSIKPALLDYGGGALVASTPNGINPDNFFYRICTQPEYGFKEYHAPTWTNPHLPQAELDKLKADNHPLVYQQEYAAEFIDWGGVAFFARESLMENGEPVAMPTRCDAVFAVIDTAIKTGADNDGTGVTFCAVNRMFGTPLVILDWDITQMEGATLDTWLPGIFAQLEQLARLTNARKGSLGAFIEDRASGQVLIQQARRRGWPGHAIDSKLTALGKDERAISVSGYVYRGEVKIAGPAFEKVSVYKNASRNHFLSQVCNFRIGVKDQADDLLDCFCYSIAIALGDSEGY